MIEIKSFVRRLFQKWLDLPSRSAIQYMANTDKWNGQANQEESDLRETETIGGKEQDSDVAKNVDHSLIASQNHQGGQSITPERTTVDPITARYWASRFGPRIYW